MKKRALQVALHAQESSVVELMVGERVQLDRVTQSTRGRIAERHGQLLEPGVNLLSLAEGHYFFRTMSDAHLHVVRGGVETTQSADDKDRGFPDGIRGDEASGELPTLTVA